MLRFHSNSQIAAVISRAALLLLCFALVTACSAAPAENPMPTQSGQPEEAYPPPVGPEAAYPGAQQPQTGYPAGPGPLGVQVVDNRSQITARVIETAPDPERAEFTHLKLEILTSDAVEGYVNYAAGAVGQQVDAYALTQDLPTLAPGDTLSAEVRYEGDERGGAYYAGNIAVVTP